MGTSGLSVRKRGFRAGKDRKLAPAIAKAFRGLASVEYTRNYGLVDNDSRW
jgi:hypothetical protein